MRLAILVVLAAFASLPARCEVAVTSGGVVKLATFGGFDQTCRSLGQGAVNVIRQPSAGAISVTTVRDYPNFPASNTRSRCNTIKMPQTRVSYQSSAGYTGYDETIIELIMPEGSVRRFRFVISVRAGMVLQNASPPVLPQRRVHVARHKHKDNFARPASQTLTHPRRIEPSPRPQPKPLLPADRPIAI